MTPVQTKQIFLFIVLGCSFVSCNEKQKNISVSFSSFSNLIDPALTIDEAAFDKHLQGMVLADRKRSAPDAFAQTYYRNLGRPLWVTQRGVSRKADSVPVFIAYYTLYPDSHGRLVEFPDIYGYDKVVLDGIRKLL